MLLPDGICVFASHCDWTKRGRTKHKLYPQLMNFRQRSIIMVHKVKSLNAFHCVSMITSGGCLGGGDDEAVASGRQSYYLSGGTRERGRLLNSNRTVVQRVNS